MGETDTEDKGFDSSRGHSGIKDLAQKVLSKYRVIDK
jgi:hypothetical protein